MVKEDKSTWKSNYFLKFTKLLDEYPKCFVVNADNVGSRQMQQIRIALRGTGVVLMGKNTMMRKAIRGHLQNIPSLDRLLPHIVGNMGLVFTKGDLNEVREILLANKVKAPAKAGAIAPCPVTLPKQTTPLGPEKTSFFQALQITTKITKGCIEILNDVNLITAGDKVGASEAALLNMLNISPFSYGLELRMVYDSGSMYQPRILDIKPEEVRSAFLVGVRNMACVSLAIGYPTAASAPHSVINGFKRLLAISVQTDYTFPEAEQTKEYLKDPSKFASAVAASAPVADAPKEEEKKEEKKEESEEESDDDMGFGLFD